MQGNAHIIVGATGTGKTTFLRNLLKRVPNKGSIIVFDPNAEYKDVYQEPFMMINDFLPIADKTNKSVIVFEEATMCFSSKSNNALIRTILVQKRHHQNYLFLNFHALAQIPKDIYLLCTHITLFYTSDGRKSIQNRFENDNLMNLFDDVQKNCKINKHYSKTLKIY